MTKANGVEHKFVTAIPEALQPGILYVSIDYRTVSHLCCCGCGAEVVTPISPTDWKITFDGATVSLWPSVGSWNLPCRSHYVINRGRIDWATDWSDEQIAVGRRRDRSAKLRFFGDNQPPKKVHAASKRNSDTRRGFWSHIMTFIGR
jgi:Family of unknown function (DUF6527)